MLVIRRLRLLGVHSPLENPQIQIKGITLLAAARHSSPSGTDHSANSDCRHQSVHCASPVDISTLDDDLITKHINEGPNE